MARRVTPLQDRARQRVKDLMAARDLAQRDVGDHIGRSAAWMSKFLGGTLDADIDTLQRLARVFRLTLCQLIEMPPDADELLLLADYRALEAHRQQPLVRAVLKELVRR